MDAQTWLASLDTQQAIFNRPVLELGDQGILRLVIEPEKRDDEQYQSHQEGPGAPSGTFQVIEARVDTVMSVRLHQQTVDPGIEIVPRSPEQLEVSEGLRTEWEWTVTAHRPGSHAMSLELWAERKGGSNVHLESIETAIDVGDVRWRKLMAGVLEFWELTLAMFSGLAWLWRRWALYRRRGGGSLVV